MPLCLLPSGPSHNVPLRVCCRWTAGGGKAKNCNLRAPGVTDSRCFEVCKLEQVVQEKLVQEIKDTNGLTY